MSNLAIEGDKILSQRAYKVRDILSQEVEETTSKLLAVMDENGAM